ncbi:tetracycline resistance protein, class B [Clostridium tepidiprofundi DSM 19306]|uniref:Tetracycline resistance protein, class B n=1 Tax=Clostridium tepidiprofundi DSM 19306 TaxID=1121338 RepID=A0A151B6C6_9CLOT|nr:SLC45 family MFS transporter [Clostridium tepidiprofundi]KYH35485.1 tetracycline resistance protein, class B [Clostridium tepidiprofundi DSM 19306]
MKKTNYIKTFLLGFGFFAISLTWTVYNAFVPLLLKRFITSAALIGFIMTFDNYFALIMQPAIGNWSDRINTKFGRRMPFVLIGMPLATIFIILMPNYSGLATLIIFLLFMNLSMSIFRAPVISLMPDITPKKDRSMANSIINFMGGIGAVAATLVGAILWSKNNKYPFYMAAVLMVLSLIVLFVFIKEKNDVIDYEAINDGKKLNLIEDIGLLFKNRDAFLLLLAICSWFIAYQGVQSIFTLYAKSYIGVSEGTAAMTLTFFSVAFLLFAIPAGILGTKLGKRKTILIGITGMVLVFILLSLTKSITTIRMLFIVGGMFWSAVNINSYPFIADMAPDGNIGTYTGFYYFFSSVAAIVSPPLVGLFMDLISYKVLFIYSAVFYFVALIFILLIKNKGK